MYGKSWGGFNGLQVAARQPPGLAAIISLYSTDDRYEEDIHWKVSSSSLQGGCVPGLSPPPCTPPCTTPCATPCTQPCTPPCTQPCTPPCTPPCIIPCTQPRTTPYQPLYSSLQGGCVLGLGLLSWAATMHCWDARPPHPQYNEKWQVVMAIGRKGSTECSSPLGQYQSKLILKTKVVCQFVI